MKDNAVVRAADAAEQQSNTVSMFERLAADPNVSVEKLRGLVELQERADARTAKAMFASAFAKMQGEVPVITKHGEIKVDGKVRSTFARYEDIDRALKPILQPHGFAITHKTRFANNLVTVVSVLMHEAGHSEETEFVTAPDTSGGKNSIQAIASAVSYGKRQNTKCLVNIAEGAEDDDGNAGGAAAVTRVTADQAATLTALIEETKSDKARFLKYVSDEARMTIGMVEEIPANFYDNAVATLRAAERARQKKAAK